MDRPVELIPLNCLRCSSPVPAEPDEAAWLCSQCGQGMLLDPNNGLLPLPFKFSRLLQPNGLGKPYWIAEGAVKLGRYSYGSADRSAREAEIFWSQLRLFFVPAFTSTLENLLNSAQHYLLNPPELVEGQSMPFEPVTLQLDDVRPAVEFVIMAVEAGRKDKLKHLEFNLDLSSPVLWILP